jgi:hypothetical protein
VTLRELFWAGVLLGLIIYMWGLLFTQMVADDHTDRNCQDCSEMLVYWGSLYSSMFTLFKAISGGVSWHDVLVPFDEMGPIYSVAFMLYVFFTYFCVCNVITGVFCNGAIETAARNPDLVAGCVIAHKKQLVKKLQALFQHIDDNGSGSGAITYHTLSNLLETEAMSSYFEAIGIDPTDVWALFKMIDSDHTMSITLDEFIEGVLRLKGGAKSLDVAIIRRDQHRLMCKLDAFMDACGLRGVVVPGLAGNVPAG